jgi:K+-sensing histidine kinase KdpD
MNATFDIGKRLDKKEIMKQVSYLGNNDVISKIMNIVNGVIAIVNESLQVVSMNSEFLCSLGIKDPEKTLGLRLGEVLHCKFYNDGKDGCGTGSYCRTCGAVIAMTACLQTGKNQSNICILSANDNNHETDLVLSVNTRRIEVEDKKYILLFLRDITDQHERKSLEKIFYHDINNTLNMMLCAGELLKQDFPSDISDIVFDGTIRLSKEIEIHRALTNENVSKIKLHTSTFSLDKLISQLKSFAGNNYFTADKNVVINTKLKDYYIKSDITLVIRILSNMILNASEASQKGDTIKLSINTSNDMVVFSVWNKIVIPNDIKLRIFQKHFSTKNKESRGLGTYSMKLLGEKFLEGKVYFESNNDVGTIFTFELPNQSN